MELEPGLSILHGQNGQGKSNLLEAAYVLAIAKSLRASSDREMVNWQAVKEGGFCQVLAQIQRASQHLKIQMDIRCPTINQQQVNQEEQGLVQKQFRVNGIPRTASDLVGELNAVMFTAQDIELVLGSPSHRRRFLDILISQIDHHYLRALQKYQKVLYQRNHLLRSMREGKAREDEITFWNQELTSEGAYIMARRQVTIQHLSDLARPVHLELTGDGDAIQTIYQPSLRLDQGQPQQQIAQAFQQVLEQNRRQEISRGMTLYGPHRDDLMMLIGEMHANLYASRGEARTLALTLRLAEAQYLDQERKDEPVLLLDDVLSELDAVRRSRVLAAAYKYQQALLTTTDLDVVSKTFLSKAVVFKVQSGQVNRA